MIIFQILGIIILIWNFNFAGLHKALRGHNLMLPWQLNHNHNNITVNHKVHIDHTHAGGNHKVHLREYLNTTKSPHSKQCELMIIIITLESALIQKVYQLWFQKHWSQIWMVTSESSHQLWWRWCTSESNDYYLCSNCNNYILACLTILRLWLVLANSRFR